MANTLQTQLVINADVQGTNEVNQLANSLGQVGDELNQATQPASATAQALGNVANSANNTHHSTTTLSQSIAQVNAGLAGTATPTTNASTAIGSLASTAGHLAHNTSHLTHSVGAVNSTLGATSSSAHTASTAMGSLTHATNQSTTAVSRLDNAMGSVRSAFGGLQGLLATLGVGLGAAEIVQLADEFNNLEARVKLATNAGGDFNAAMTSIKTIADSTAMPLTATADLFSKLTQSTKELGYSQSEVLDLTQTISQAMAVSGGDMASMEAGLTQLAQGLSAGALRGDELNSVLEQSPRLATALADGLGATIGELKAMGAEGKLTAQAVGDALKSQADVIANEFAQMPATVSGSLTVLKNSLMGFIGELDNTLGGSDGVAGVIKNIATYIDQIDPSTIENLGNALSAVGTMAKGVYEGLIVIPNTLQDIVNGFFGFEEGGRQLGLLQAMADGLAISTGAVADGITALNVAFNLVFGGIVREVGRVVHAIGMITGKGRELGAAMIQSGQQMIDSAEQTAAGYQSHLGKAFKSIGKTAQDTANQARADYEQMAAGGTASAQALEEAFKTYAHKAIEANNGMVDSTLKQELAQKGLQAVVDDTGKVIISSMDNAKKAVDGVDLSKHADSFKALGIDMSEFAGGLSSKVSTALGAFNDLAKVAGSNLEQLAMAYNGAKGAIGDNTQGLAELDKALSQAVGGSTSLAQGIKALATEQQNAKNATTDQQKALQALGVEMNAINQGMSQSGQKMVDSLRVGITAIKDTATNATALKTALAKALDTSLQKAQTVADFNAIKKAIEEAGLASQVSSAQMQALQAASAKAQGATKEQTAATTAQTTATKEQTAATAHATHTKKQNAAAAREAAQATDALATSQKNATNQGIDFGANLKQHVRALKDYGANAQALEQVNNELFKSLEGRTYGWFEPLLQDMDRLAKHTKNQLEDFKQLGGELDTYSKKLSSSSLSVNDLNHAQALLNNATNMTINNIHVMDQAKLEQLQAQIDQARAKMQGLADDAKNTADSLEGELARMQGNEVHAMELEAKQKLEAIEKRIKEARARGNSEEIAQLQRQLELQRQINQEKLKKHQEQEQQKQERQKSNTQGQSNQKPTSDNSTTSQTTLSASEVAGAFGDAINQARRGAVNDFARQLMSEAKRMAR